MSGIIERERERVCVCVQKCGVLKEWEIKQDLFFNSKQGGRERLLSSLLFFSRFVFLFYRFHRIQREPDLYFRSFSKLGLKSLQFRTPEYKWVIQHRAFTIISAYFNTLYQCICFFSDHLWANQGVCTMAQAQVSI